MPESSTLTELQGPNLAILTMLTDHGQAIRDATMTMNTGFADLRARLDNKADKSDIMELRVRIQQLEQHKDAAHEVINKRLDNLEDIGIKNEAIAKAVAETRTRQFSLKQKWAAALASFFLIAATVISPLITAHVI